MKIEFKTKPLVEAISIARRALPSSTPKEILKHMKLEVADGSVSLFATDLECSVLCQVVDAAVSEPGECLLHTKAIEALLGIGGDSVVVSSDGAHVTIAGDRERYKLAASDPTEFPRIKQESDRVFQVPSCELASALKIVSSGCSDKPDSRYVTQGIFFDPHGGRLTLVATDTKKMVVFRLGSEIPSPWDGDVVVPKKSVSAIISAAIAFDGAAVISVSDSSLIVHCGQTTVVSRLIEGRFPGWRQWAEKLKWGISAQTVAGPLRSAIDRASIFNDRLTSGVTLAFADDVLSLRASTADIGESEFSLPVVLTGGAADPSIDPALVNPFLKTLPTEEAVRVDMRDSESTVAIRTSDPRVEFFVMPLSKER